MKLSIIALVMYRAWPKMAASALVAGKRVSGRLLFGVLAASFGWALGLRQAVESGSFCCCRCLNRWVLVKPANGGYIYVCFSWKCTRTARISASRQICMCVWFFGCVVQQYWVKKDVPHQFMSVEEMGVRMQQSPVGVKNAAHLATPFIAKPDAKEALIYTRSALTRK